MAGQEPTGPEFQQKERVGTWDGMQCFPPSVQFGIKSKIKWPLLADVIEKGLTGIYSACARY